MFVFTIRNAVLIALLQVVIIVAGALASGLSHKWWASAERPLPQTTMFLINYGVVILALPVVWIASVLKIRISASLPDEVKGLAFLSGFVVIVGLLGLIAHGVITPWFQHRFQEFERAPDESFFKMRLSPDQMHAAPAIAAGGTRASEAEETLRQIVLESGSPSFGEG